MSNYRRNRSVRSSWAAIVMTIACTAMWCGLYRVSAQTAAPQRGEVTVGKMKFYALKWNFIPTTPAKLRLEGNAYVISPEMDIRAPILECDIKQTAEVRSVTEVRAYNGVNFKMDVIPASPQAQNKGGQGNSTPRNGKQTTPTITHIEVKTNEATANLVSGTLVLTGNVDGWYRAGNGAPTALRGKKATLKLVQQNLTADLEGGPEGVRLEIPPEVPTKTANPGDPPNQNANLSSLGAVVVTSQRATLNANLAAGANQNSGNARFIGNARAVSTDGPTKFDMTAPEFVLTRQSAGTIENLKTTGRTHLVIDFPPQVAPTAPNRVENDAANANRQGNQNTANNRASFGQPTHVEADADVVTVQRATNTIVLEGNISGLYRLVAAANTANGAPNAAPQDFNFSGNRVELKYGTDGLQVNAEGAPAMIETPDINMRFGGAE